MLHNYDGYIYIYNGYSFELIFNVKVEGNNIIHTFSIIIKI